MGEELKGDCRKLHNEELNDLHTPWQIRGVS